VSPSRRPSRPEDRPIFLIPRIPGTGLFALLGVSLVGLTAISAYMQLHTSESPESLEPSEPSIPLVVRSVRLIAEPAEVLAYFDAEPIGLDMWRLPDGRAGPVLFMLEEDGLWAHGITDPELDAIIHAGFAFEEIELERSSD